MSQAAEPESSQTTQIPIVLTATVHDVRYFSALIRGVSFSNRGTVTIAETGIVIKVEEARTLLATAFIDVDMFDEFAYNPPMQPARSSPSPEGEQDEEEEEPNATFEIPLNILIDCLNIYGTAGSSAPSQTTTQVTRHKKWRRAGDDPDDTAGRGDAPRTIDQHFAALDGKGTGMRMTYAGAGFPLTLLIAEEASGPTTTCEIATFEAEAQLELPFDADRTVLKIILKSQWLRDALSELDTTCEKLTLIGNPPQDSLAPKTQEQKPMFRIQSSGTFGTSELDYPNDRDVLETFDCVSPVSFTYRFAHISRALRALQTSSKTSLRIDDEGLLSLQFLVPSQKPRGGTSNAFIELRCLAQDEVGEVL